MDIVDPQRRSQMMAKIGPRHTRPELVVRRLLHTRGFRYRLHPRDLPGSPAVVFPRRRQMKFVHGCFWHRHDFPAGKKWPKANHGYWRNKLHQNVARDRQAQYELTARGWQSIIIWECELGGPEAVLERLEAFLASTRAGRLRLDLPSAIVLAC